MAPYTALINDTVFAEAANEELVDQSKSTVVEDSSNKADDEQVKTVEMNSDAPTFTTKEPVVHQQIVWRNVVLFGYLHIISLYAIYPMFTSAMWQTNVFTAVLYILSGLGVTAGVHRLWSHRTYKAKLSLRIFLALIFTIPFQKSIYEWCRDHRVHHKFSETDADPHNATRGFFFAHVGWLLCRKHPEVIRKGNIIDLSDLLADPVVRFHRKYYLQLVLLLCFILPTVIPMYFWNETFLNSLLIPTLFRLCLTFNTTWLVNSAAHLWGSRPYDVHINPRENFLVSLGAVGEGYHNYHHTFPFDYATSELGAFNPTTAFIDALAWLGLAYDRKTASKAMIKARKLRTGEDSLKNEHNLGREIVKED